MHAHRKLPVPSEAIHSALLSAKQVNAAVLRNTVAGSHCQQPDVRAATRCPMQRHGVAGRGSGLLPLAQSDHASSAAKWTSDAQRLTLSQWPAGARA
eukprot:6211929-Pleurochrysis_carterae.AAC.1